jgi:hypothetical protein
MELSLIGLQNAGKTSLVNVIATGAFHEDMIPTVGFNMRKVTRGSVTIKLWDLGGQACSSVKKRSTMFSAHCLARPRKALGDFRGSKLLWVVFRAFKLL